MSKLVIASLLLSACATTGATLEHNNPAPHARIQFDPSAVTGVKAAFPEAIEPRVRAVDRIAHLVRARLGGVATAQLELCVAPAGKVTKVTLARSSSFETFDAALLQDAQAWRFASLPGPTTVQSCRHATISYTAH
jgi:TonB family protein